MRDYMDRAHSLSPKDAEEAEKFLSDLKIYLPEKGPYLDAWKNLLGQVQARRATDKVKTFKVVGTAPPVPAAPAAPVPSPSASRSDMQTLLSLVAEREAALNARSSMSEAKEKARRSGATDQNLIFRLSRYEEGNGDEAVAKNDFSGAKSLYRVLDRTYGLSPHFRDDAAAATALSVMVGALKSETAQLPASAVDPWLGQYAAEIDSQARVFMEKKDFQNAGAAFLRSAFLYEKIKDSAGAAKAIVAVPMGRERLPR
jgi:hypothetical protein